MLNERDKQVIRQALRLYAAKLADGLTDGISADDADEATAGATDGELPGPDEVELILQDFRK